ncbi:putative transcription factor MADS-type1 family [Helianthus annuus]|nr:putative transcription factor MADS-type1 family [Helianthus annuus]
MAKKPSLGRQKIKIAKIQIKNHLQVTFSKRRSGLFKKASELCTLCGVEIAIVVFSPAGKVFSFGHPKVELIADRFLARNPNLNSTSLHLVESHRLASIPELNMQLMYMLNELETEKKRSEALDEMRKDGRSQFWWEAPIEDLNLHELEQLKDSMEELKKTIGIQANKLFAESSDSISIFGTNNNNINGGVDHYQMIKPGSIISSSSGGPHVQSYGYVHGMM